MSSTHSSKFYGFEIIKEKEWCVYFLTYTWTNSKWLKHVTIYPAMQKIKESLDCN
jgi:hypothetical protein